MTTDTPSSEWTVPEVLARLRAKAGDGNPVSAQVFLHDDTPAENVPHVAEEIVKAAKKTVGEAAAGEVHRLAKSFSLRADVDTLAAVANMPKVKTVLPSEISDIFPRPVKTPPA